MIKQKLFPKSKKTAEWTQKDLQHFVYAGNYYNCKKHVGKLHDWIYGGLQEYKTKNNQFKIKPSMVTTLRMARNQVISKVSVDLIYNGIKNAAIAEEIGIGRHSIFGDIEELFEKIQFGKDIVEGKSSYFLPMLAEKDIELLRTNNEDYLRSYFVYYHEQMHPESDINKASSESESSYAEFRCYRYTSMIVDNPRTFRRSLV